MKNNVYITDKTWFNPVNVVFEFKRLESGGVITPKIRAFKKLREAYVTAVALIGMISKLNLQFWLQIIDDAEGSPDIKTICFNPQGAVNDLLIQDVEVVIWNKYSGDDLVDFLLQTKLSAKKGYDDLTNVLCFVDKCAVLPPVNDINRSLLQKKISRKFPIILLGKLFENQEQYRLVQIYPNVAFDIQFDLMEECKKIRYAGGFFFERKGKPGEKPVYVNDGTKIYPFESLGFK